MPRNKFNFFAAMSGMRADYAMATENRYRRQRTGVTATGGPGDWHFRSEASLIGSREYIRDMVRNDVGIGPTIEKAVQQQIQSGGRSFEPTDGGLRRQGD